MYVDKKDIKVCNRPTINYAQIRSYTNVYTNKQKNILYSTYVCFK